MLLAAVDFDNLHQVLRVLYDEMMPLCSNMTGVAKGIAGLGALFYVAAKVINNGDNEMLKTCCTNFWWVD